MRYHIIWRRALQPFELHSDNLAAVLATAQALTDRYPMLPFEVWAGDDRHLFTFVGRRKENVAPNADKWCEAVMEQEALKP